MGLDNSTLQQGGVFQPNVTTNDTGIAAELSLDFWYPVTARTWLGAELALPYSRHTGGIAYSSIDVAVLFGVRR